MDDDAFEQLRSMVERCEHERDTLERALHAARRMEALGRMADGVAHDFNNLLTVVLSYAEALRYELPEVDPRRRDVDEIHIAAGRAVTLARQLLAFGHRRPARARAVDINRAINSLGSLLDRILGGHIELQLQLDEQVGEVRMDPGELEQILLNLALRARDRMPDGGRLAMATANVWLDEARAAAVGLQAGHFVRLSVSDELPPPSAEAATNGARRIEAADAAMDTVRAAAQASGGAVVGDGLRTARVDVFLPWDVAQARTEPRSGVEIAVATPHGSHRTVLLVEDDAALRRLTARVLREHGLDVLAARDGEHALSKASIHDADIDLLVTDMVMPRMGGREVARQLMHDYPRLQVLFISGFTDDPIGLRSGATRTSFLPKPYTRSALLHEVERLLERVA